MIYDRTSNDVSRAISIRTNVLQKGISITDEEREALERGLLTVNTINRIEEKQTELKEYLINMGYLNTGNVVNKSWGDTDIFKENDLKRIIANNSILRSAFFVFASTPISAIAKYSYNEINKIERFLHDLEEMTKIIQERYKYCGTVQCGEVG